jgi:hypothetical protein
MPAAGVKINPLFVVWCLVFGVCYFLFDIYYWWIQLRSATLNN